MTGNLRRYIFSLLLFVWPVSLTAQSAEELIVKIYAEELDYIAKNRIEYLNAKAGKPVATRENVLSRIAQSGVSMQEYIGARSVVSENKEFNGFLFSHRLEDGEELKLFNNFLKAYLDDYTEKEPSISVPESELMLTRTRTKNKMKVQAPEPVTGGELWTLSNEMRVIFKKTPPRGRFSYSLVLKGGFSEVPGLKFGEGPYVGDMLGLYDISGIKWYDFRRALKVRGIEMDCNVSITDMEIYGSAPVGELRTLLVALSSIATDRKLDSDAFAYYQEGLAMKPYPLNPVATADSLMRPQYRYSSYKYLRHLPDDFPSRADRFFNKQFSKVNDGILILTGDINSSDTQKILEQTTGDFQTSRAYSIRPMVQYVMRSGNSSCVLDAAGADRQADMVISAEMPVTSSGYMAVKLARIEIENRLKARLGNVDVNVKEIIEYFPVERVFVTICCREADDVESMMSDLKRAFSEVLETGIEANALKTDKAVLIDELGRWIGSRRGLIEAASLRYSEGKDYMNGYKQKVEKVSQEDVNAVLKALASGASVDIIYR